MGCPGLAGQGAEKCHDIVRSLPATQPGCRIHGFRSDRPIPSPSPLPLQLPNRYLSWEEQCPTVRPREARREPEDAGFRRPADEAAYELPRERRCLKDLLCRAADPITEGDGEQCPPEAGCSFRIVDNENDNGLGLGKGRRASCSCGTLPGTYSTAASGIAGMSTGSCVTLSTTEA